MRNSDLKMFPTSMVVYPTLFSLFLCFFFLFNIESYECCVDPLKKFSRNSNGISRDYILDPVLMGSNTVLLNEILKTKKKNPIESSSLIPLGLLPNDDRKFHKHSWMIFDKGREIRVDSVD